MIWVWKLNGPCDGGPPFSDEPPPAMGSSKKLFGLKSSDPVDWDGSRWPAVGQDSPRCGTSPRSQPLVFSTGEGGDGVLKIGIAGEAMNKYSVPRT